MVSTGNMHDNLAEDWHDDSVVVLSAAHVWHPYIMALDCNLACSFSACICNFIPSDLLDEAAKREGQGHHRGHKHSGRKSRMGRYYMCASNMMCFRRSCCFRVQIHYY